MKSRFYASLLSVTMPGLGQIYNSQFTKAIILLLFEHMINKLAHINAALMLCLNGNNLEALELINYGYALFYPGFYVLCTFDAVLHAEQNPNKNSAIWFIVAGISGCLGVIYSQFIPMPILTVGLGIIIIMLIGTFACAHPPRESDHPV